MIQELREIQQQTGAILNPETQIPETFNNDSEALKAIHSGVVLSDRSHWGLLEVSGADKIRFLHNQTTNDFNNLKVGQGCETVFVTSTARTIDLVTAYLTENEILLLTSPQKRTYLMQWMDRFLFPMDKVSLKDISDQYAIFNLIGNGSNLLLEKIGFTPIINQPEYSHQSLTFEEINIRICVGSGLALPGYTLIISLKNAANFWLKLINMGAIPLGNNLWEKLRIQQGRPLRDQELTEDYNPLEAGLWQTISFNKGCYIGQETIARLNTYKGVKQRLWGIKLTAPVAVGDKINLDGNKIGIVTSYTSLDNQFYGLGYVKTKAGGEGLKVNIGEVEGELIAVPFLTHEYYC